MTDSEVSVGYLQPVAVPLSPSEQVCPLGEVLTSMFCVFSFTVHRKTEWSWTSILNPAIGWLLVQAELGYAVISSPHALWFSASSFPNYCLLTALLLLSSFTKESSLTHGTKGHPTITAPSCCDLGRNGDIQLRMLCFIGAWDGTAPAMPGRRCSHSLLHHLSILAVGPACLRQGIVSWH